MHVFIVMCAVCGGKGVHKKHMPKVIPLLTSMSDCELLHTDQE